MVIRARTGKDGKPYRTGHKPLALVYSLALHMGVVALLFLPSSVGSTTGVYHAAVVELEKNHKLIYYDFRKELPAVSASNPTGKVTTPSPDAVKSKQRIVAALKEKPGKQLVYLPEPRVKLKTDLTAPNLIAIETPREVPLPDRPKPKPFQAPENRKSARSQVTPLPNAPALAANANSKDPALTTLLNKPSAPVKQFTAPARTNTATASAPTALPNAPAVAAGAGENTTAIAALLNKSSGPPPKKFMAPALATSASGSAPAPLPTAPALAGSGGDKSSTISALLDRPSGPVRQFTAPAQSGVGAGSAAALTALPNAPAVGSGPSEQNSAISALLNKPGGPPPKPFTAPAPASGTSAASGSETAALPAPPSVSSGAPSASATVAILGLNPANVPQIPRPEGSRPARIDAGTPVPGATRAELGGGNSSVSLPDVSIQGGAPTSPAVATRSPLDNQLGEPATGLARPRAPEVLPTTPHVSAPQWPSSRHLPAAVEHHFQNRVVYTTLIPSAQSSDDWIVWFSEVEIVATDANMVMHPPILLKAGFLPPILAHNDHGTGNIRLTGIIHKDGHLTSLTALAGGAADRELVEALQAWQFSPARRNGVIIDADAVIEIPVVFGKLSLR